MRGDETKELRRERARDSEDECKGKKTYDKLQRKVKDHDNLLRRLFGSGANKLQNVEI